MKIASWNVNGIRRFSDGKVKKMLEDIDADVFCIQETKLPREAITADVALIEGYNSYFSFCYSGRKGYSGVATFCKDTCKPHLVYDHLSASGSEKPLGDVEVDGEGRAIITEFYLKSLDDTCLQADANASASGNKRFKLAIINVYCVNYVPENAVRFEYKMRHHALLEARADWYRDNGSHVIFLGDLNIAHKRIDHCEAHLMPDFDAQPHRIWLSKMFAKGYVDCFRNFYPAREKAYTVWNQKTGARATNYGTRVDYFVANKELLDLDVFSDCKHLTDFYGSDHCPLVLEFKKNWVLDSSSELSPLCTKFFPKFRCTQKSLDSFFTHFPGVSSQSKLIKKKPHNKKQSLLSDFFIKQDVHKNKAAVCIDEEGKICSESSPCGSTTIVKEYGVKKYSNSTTASLSQNVLKSSKPVPKCSHGELAIERTVKRKGPNYNRRFYICARPQGFANDKNARCNYFQWA